MKRILLLLLFCAVIGALAFFARATNVPPCTPASITKQPASQTNCQGSTVHFTVTASGSTPLSYQWRKNSTNLINGGNISGVTTTNLTITNITTANAASYTVVVSNTCSRATSAPPAVLTVNVSPTITTQPANQIVFQGSNATFTVTASGGSLLYQWQRNGTNLNNGGNISGATTASLTISNVTASDAASYTVVVANCCGSMTSAPPATLTVYVLPSAISGLTLWLEANAGITTNASAQISTWADQSGNTNNATQSTTYYQPLYVTNALNGLPVVQFNPTNSSDMQYFNLSNILNGTTQAEAFVVLKADLSDYWSPGPLWDMGTDYSGTERYPDGNGNIVDDFGSTSAHTVGDLAQPLDQYHIYEVASRDNYWAAWINGELQVSTANNTYGYNSTPTLGLGAYSGLFFPGDIAEVLVFDRTLTAGERLTVNRYLNGKYGLVPAIPAMPTNLTATAISPTQIGLTWDETLNGGITQISIERKIGSNGAYQAVAQISGASTYVDTNLTPNTQYYYRVRAINLTQWSPYSNETNATTLGGGADMPVGDLLLWLKADSGVTLQDTNNTVRTWIDQSGNANNATQVTTNYQPSWVAEALNGHPVVHFEPTNVYPRVLKYFTLPDFLNGTTQAEAFVVLKAVVTNNTYGGQELWKIGSDDSYTEGYPDYYGNIVDDFGSTSAYTVGDPAQPLDQYHVYEVASQNNYWAAWINGELQISSSTNTYDYNSTPTLGLNFSGDIAEVLVFDRALTVGERLAVNEYLNGKYAVVAMPAAPTNLMATAISTSQVILTWSFNLGTASTGFEIERKTGAGGTYAHVATVQDAVSYVDSSLAAGTTYYYKVAAVNWTGTSGYSNETNATTLASGADLPLSNLLLWLKADGGLLLQNTNDGIKTWLDQSGNANNASQEATDNQPLWVAGMSNGFPVVRFDGYSRYFNLPNLLNGTTQAEAFVVLKAAADAAELSQYQPLWCLGASGSYYLAYPDYYGDIVDDFGSASAHMLVNPTQPLDQYHVYEVAGQTNCWSAWINGLLQSTTTNNTYGYNSAPTLGYCNGYSFVGDVAEVLVFNRALNAGERDTINNYLNLKYAVVTVPVPPTIITQPTSQAAYGGGTVTFTVVASGTAPLFYQWWFNGTNLLVGATGTALTLTNVQWANAGNYSVTVTNALGSTNSSNASLTLLVPPSIIQQPTNQTACVSNTVQFTVAVRGTAPLSYQWQFNGTNLLGDPDATLAFKVLTNNAGNYSVIVANAYGSAISSNASLTVLVPPSFTRQPTNQTAMWGADVVFRAVAAGAPPLAYQWYFNTDTPLPGETNDTLVLTNVQMSQAGSYAVIVSDFCNSLSSSNAILEIAVPTILSDPLTDFTFQSNTTYYIDSSVQLYGVTTIEGGAVIKYAGQPEAQMTLNGPLVCLSGPGSSMAVLTSKDDNSAGVTIEGSTGNPTNTNSGTYLSDQSGLTNDYRFLRLAYAGIGISGSGVVSVRDSQFVQCVTAVDNSNGGTVTLMNNLFYYSPIANFATNLPSMLALSNNLVFGTTVNLPQPSDTVWYAFNNDFDTCTITNSTLTNGFNAYLNCNDRLYPTNANDVVTNATLAYQTSWLGSFYQPTNSPLIHAGSTTADQVGLYHYTVTTNQVIEGTNRVSIGYHYMATDNNGNPLDSNSNGIPDYLEDANGNGLVDNGERNWELAILRQPQSQGVILGSDVTLGVTAAGKQPLGYQWYFNGNTVNNATNATLMLNNVQTNSMGDYHVVVSNSYGSVTSSNATLRVTTVFIITQPLSQTVCDYDTVTVSVVAGGSGILTYQWTWNGVPIPGATDSSYTINNFNMNDGGDYAVTVANGTDSVTSTNATLTGWGDVTKTPYIIAPIGSRQDYIFRSGITYYIGSPIQLYGNTIIEGGAVIKFDWTTNSTLQVMNLLTCKTEQYNPAILTSTGDDAVGTPFYWSYYFGYPEPVVNGVPYLDLSAITNGSVGNLRVCFADEGILTPSGRLDIWDCQFVDCNTATIASPGATNSLHNVLFAGCGTAVAASTNFTEIDAEQVTANVTNFWSALSPPSRINLTNSIILGTFGSGSTVSSQNVAMNPSGTVFQTVDNGNYYLATNSPYHNAGTTNISPRLLAELHGKTTYPPIGIAAFTQISGDMMLLPTAPRYTNGAPDLGYYYAALDYTVADCFLTGGNLTVEPGTAMALRNEYYPDYGWYAVEGFDVREGSTFVSHGTLAKPNVFTTEKMVQETSETDFFWWQDWVGIGFDAISFIPDFEPNDNNSPAPVLDFRFTKFYLPTWDYHIWSGMDEWDFFWASLDSAMYLNLQDCSFHGGNINLGNPNYYYYPPDWVFGPGAVSWVNNSFENVCINIDPTYYEYGLDDPGSLNVDLSFQAYNNLFRNNIWLILEPIPASAGNWVFKDNLFDKVDFLVDPYKVGLPLDYDYNGYWPLQPIELRFNGWDTNQLTSATAGQGGNEQVLSSPPPYQTGPFGHFYLPNTTLLYGAGSRSPGDAGLYHYTTQTNQFKEGNEPSGHMVNIGVHYVAATNSQPSTFNYQPIDTDGDGIPDYVENWHGDGNYPAHTDTETDWQNPMTDGVTNDAYSTIYDAIDLDGDGLTGAAERFFGTNPLIPDNPLDLVLSAIPQQSTLSGIVQIPLNIGTNVDTNTVFQLFIDGAEADATVYQTNGNWFATWDTITIQNGTHLISVRFSDLNIPGNKAFGCPKVITVNNVITLNEMTRWFTDNLTIDAQVNIDASAYTIDIYDAETQEYLKTLSGSVISNEIEASWNLQDGQGNTIVDGPLSCDFYLTPSQSSAQASVSGISANASPQQGSPGPGMVGVTYNFINHIHGEWFTAGYGYDYDVLSKQIALQNMMLNSVVNNLNTDGDLYTAVGGGKDYNLVPTGPGGNVPACSAWRYYNNQASRNVLESALSSSANFYWWGHGSESTISPHGESAPGTDFGEPAGSVAHILHNKETSLHSQIYNFEHPYRLVILDSCDGYSKEWAYAFGIIYQPWGSHYSVNDYKNTFHLDPQAFVAWTVETPAPSPNSLTSGGIYEYKNALNILFTEWQYGRPLNVCMKKYTDELVSYGFTDDNGYRFGWWSFYGSGIAVRNYKISGCVDLTTFDR